MSVPNHDLDNLFLGRAKQDGFYEDSLLVADDDERSGGSLCHDGRYPDGVLSRRPLG